MKKFVLPLLLLSLSCNKNYESSSAVQSDSKAAPAPPAHIIVLWLENKDSLPRSDAPYINSLSDSGTIFTNYHGVIHPSQGNYIALFSGALNGITDDKCFHNKLNAPNLYSELALVGKTCIWYSEDLPADGSTACSSGNYVKKHNASSGFANVPDSANKPFSEFPTDYNNLPSLAFITPNMQDDMHDGSIKKGDKWIKKNCSALADWCKNNNSLFIITTDESDTKDSNHITTIAYGENVLSGNAVNTYYDHYNMTETICALLGASTTWTDNLINRIAIQGWLIKSPK